MLAPVASSAEDSTAELWRRWRVGDREALDTLIRRDMQWVRACVNRCFSESLRPVGDIDDFVQDTAVQVVRFSRRFSISSHRQFRALMAKIAVNVMRMGHRYRSARKRIPTRVEVAPTVSEQPVEAAVVKEQQAWLRVGLLLVKPGDAEVLALYRHGLRDHQIAVRLGIRRNAARMRRERAVARLGRIVEQLIGGDLQLRPRG